MTEEVRPDRGRWQYARGAMGELRSVTTPQGQQRRYRYNARGAVVREELADGTQWRYDYDHYGRLAQTQAPSGATTRQTQDVLGRVSAVQDALGFTTRYRHARGHAGPAGSVCEVRRPDGITERVAYSRERQVSAVTDGAGKTTGYQYGAFDLLKAVMRPDGQTLRFHYDRLARLSGVTTAGGQTWRYVRDACGQIISEQDFSGREIRYDYDGPGRRIRAWSPGGLLTTWHYAPHSDRVVMQRSWQCTAQRSVLTGCVTYAYDAAGRLCGAVNDDAQVHFTRDAHGQITQECLNGQAVTYAYDAAGRVTVMHSGEVTVHSGYDAAGRLASVAVNGHAALTLGYTARGEEQWRESAAGFALLSNYTACGLLANQAGGRSTAALRRQRAESGPQPVGLSGTAVSRGWQYDGADNVTGVDDWRWGSRRYRYDANDQIVAAWCDGAHPQVEQFCYDGQLNLCGGPGEGGGPGMQAVVQRHGRVTRRGGWHYRYDAAGRLTEKRETRNGFRPRVWRYAWNGQHQLAGLRTPSGAYWRYRYDAFGRRTGKWRVSGGPRTGWRYDWSGTRMIQEVPLDAHGRAQARGAVQWVYAPGGQVPVARYAGGVLHYVVADGTGSPRELLTESGALAWSSRSRTWGETEIWPQPAAGGPEAPWCHLRFAGQYADAESGLHYNHHRYYDPQTAQYLSPDPLGLAGGLNPYGYVHNPLSYIDPLGLAACPLKGNNWEFDPVKDVDLRGTGKTYRDALYET